MCLNNTEFKFIDLSNSNTDELKMFEKLTEDQFISFIKHDTIGSITKIIHVLTDLEFRISNLLNNQGGCFRYKKITMNVDDYKLLENEKSTLVDIFNISNNSYTATLQEHDNFVITLVNTKQKQDNNLEIMSFNSLIDAINYVANYVELSEQKELPEQKELSNKVIDDHESKNQTESLVIKNFSDLVDGYRDILFENDIHIVDIKTNVIHQEIIELYNSIVIVLSGVSKNWLELGQLNFSIKNKEHYAISRRIVEKMFTNKEFFGVKLSMSINKNVPKRSENYDSLLDVKVKVIK